jgi:hypothetical protein
MEYGKVGVGLLAISAHKDEARALSKFMADRRRGADPPAMEPVANWGCGPRPQGVF